MAGSKTPRRVGLEADGFTTACAHLADIRSGTLDLLAFVHLHKPELIIYDLPRPSERGISSARTGGISSLSPSPTAGTLTRGE